MMKRNHLGSLEFSVFVFKVSGISVKAATRLTRHRIASYSQKSSRHTEVKDKTDVIFCINARSLMNLIAQRTCMEACDEMRDLAMKLLEIVISIDPMFVEAIRPKCSACAIGACRTMNTITKMISSSEFKLLEKRFIILISGKQRAGKTTMANMLAKHHFLCFSPIVMSFATPLKIASQLMGFAEDDKQRKFKQILGTDIGRNLIDYDVWVKLAMKHLNHDFAHRLFIFDDTRFKNENTFVRDNFFSDRIYHIHIESDRNERKKRGQLEGEDHPSEQGTDYMMTAANRVVYNNGTIEMFDEEIEFVANDIKKMIYSI